MSHQVSIIGGGPAGLMAAEVLLKNGAQVALYEAMPSPGRKFLVAGKGGLNLTHSEPREDFLSRYGVRRPQIEPLLDAFGPNELREWARELGVDLKMIRAAADRIQEALDTVDVNIQNFGHTNFCFDPLCTSR